MCAIYFAASMRQSLTFLQLYINYFGACCLLNRSIEFDEFLEFVIARQGDGRDVHNEIIQVQKVTSFNKTN